MGELKQRDIPHLWRLLPRQVIFNRKRNPREDRAPLFSPLPQALAPQLPPKAPEPGTGNPSPTPCFPGAESPKFSPISSTPEGAGRGRVGERSPQASCWVGSPALGAAGVPGAAGPARPSRRFALTACLPARRPPSLPPAPCRRPHAARAAAEHLPRRGLSHRRCRSRGAPCGRLGHGGQRRTD